MNENPENRKTGLISQKEEINIYLNITMHVLLQPYVIER